jgi:hypothetical protein
MQNDLGIALVQLLQEAVNKSTTNDQVLAQSLDRSVSTIQTEWSRIHARLGVNCRAEAIMVALERKIILLNREREREDTGNHEKCTDFGT